MTWQIAIAAAILAGLTSYQKISMLRVAEVSSDVVKAAIFTFSALLCTTGLVLVVPQTSTSIAAIACGSVSIAAFLQSKQSSWYQARRNRLVAIFSIGLVTAILYFSATPPGILIIITTVFIDQVYGRIVVAQVDCNRLVRLDLKTKLRSLQADQRNALLNSPPKDPDDIYSKAG